MKTDPMEIFQEAMSSLENGKHQEALESFRHLQTSDVTNARPYNALRRTYALSGWVELSKIYPPAKVELDNLLLERRRALEANPSNTSLQEDIKAMETRMQ